MTVSAAQLSLCFLSERSGEGAKLVNGINRLLIIKRISHSFFH